MSKPPTGRNWNSEKWRSVGNEKYKSAFAEGIGKSVLAGRMKEAINCYHQAYDLAEDNSDMASAARNLAVAYWKMVPLQRYTGVQRNIMVWSYKQSLTFFGKAHSMGSRCKDFTWFSQVNRQLERAVQDAFHFHLDSPPRERLGLYEQYAQCLPDMVYKAKCYLKIAIVVFQEGIVYLSKGNYGRCLNNMAECYRPIQEAKRLSGGDKTIVHEAEILEKDCLLHTCTAESIQARVVGDDLLKKSLESEEELQMDGVWSALDCYKKAVLLTRENDLEMEAIAISRIGDLYNKVLKNKVKAKEHFKRCVYLANSMSPRNFAMDEWFKVATRALQCFQQQVVAEEDSEWNKKRQTFKEQLVDELEDLRKASSKSHEDFLRFLYKRFPPKKSQQKLDTSGGLKAAFRTALIHYHPDKQKVYGEKWLVLCEEVTKLLCRKYEYYK